jgi:hypothetical protein
MRNPANDYCGEKMWKIRLIIALFVGSVFGGLSFFLEQLSGSTFAGVILFLFPGAIVGIVSSGNVHEFSGRAVAVGNFVFYFGFTYLVMVLWAKYRVWEKYKEKYGSKAK